ncbi:MAG: hypothetical protein M3296_05905 [Actinomycetota bacterium]|nr:hypothetical protein [Actinomycetota bacterium]
MRGILRGTRGMAPLVLVIVIVWALLSVLLLTGTLLAARSIDRSVGRVIKPHLKTIRGDTAGIRLAGSTARLTTRIERGTKPLSGELDRTIKAAKPIDRKLKQILVKVGSINQTAGTINGNVLSIGATVGSIHGTLLGVNTTVHGILSSAQSINRSAHGINGSVHSIQGHLSRTLSSTHSIISHVRSIDGKVARANGQAKSIIDAAPGIAGDLHTVLGIVGTGTQHSPTTISGHANSIDCSNLLVVSNALLLGRDQCGQ